MCQCLSETGVLWMEIVDIQVCIHQAIFVKLWPFVGLALFELRSVATATEIILTNVFLHLQLLSNVIIVICQEHTSYLLVGCLRSMCKFEKASALFVFASPSPPPLLLNSPAWNWSYWQAFFSFLQGSSWAFASWGWYTSGVTSRTKWLGPQLGNFRA